MPKKRGKRSRDAVGEAAAPHAVGPGLGAAAFDPDERPRRKNYYLYQSKIDLAKEVLGVETETEAIERALDFLIYGEALARGTRAMSGEVYHDDLFDIGSEVPEL
jgi:hypothetical protein